VQVLNTLKIDTTSHLVMLAALCVSTIGLLVLLFWSTATSIVGIWSASETFTHGYFVIPVFLWLVWRQSDVLAELQIQPDILALVPLIGAGALWLLCKLAGIQAGEHMAFVLILIFALWAAMGRAMARQLKFPLAFLTFLAPVGEELVPQLMEITADMTVWAIRQTSIPIYREGLFFSLPSGNWSVVEACSGIRYLISSTVLGALYAYLSFNSMRIRIGFVVMAIAVPILANSMRAFMIVMLGHFSGNKIATGVDHLVYGWLFFGIVMFALFSIGGWLKKYDTVPPKDTGNKKTDDHEGTTTFDSETTLATRISVEHASARYLTKLPTLVVIATIIAAWPLWFAATAFGNTSIKSQPLAAYALPDGLIIDDSVRPLVSTASAWQPRNYGHDFRVEANYSGIESKNGILPTVRTIAFVYQDQRQGKEMVSTRNALVASTDDPWRLTSSTVKTIEPTQHSNGDSESISTNTISIKESVIQSTTQKLIVWQWYRIGNTRTSNALVAKLTEVRNKLLIKDAISTAYILATDANNDNYEIALSNALALIDSEIALQ